MDEGGVRQGLLGLTTEIVAAYAGHNAVATSDLPKLIGTVFEALRGAGVDGRHSGGAQDIGGRSARGPARSAR